MKKREYDWGFEIIMADTQEYFARTIILKDNAELPYIFHRRQKITLFLVQNGVLFITEGRTIQMKPGDSRNVHPNVKYKVVANNGEATLIEVGTKRQDDVVFVEG